MLMPELAAGVRPAAPDDVPSVLRLIVALATHEGSADQVRTSPDQLHDALFGPDPVAAVLVAEHDGELVGFALYHRTYSTWVGRAGLHLEDLYVGHEARGTGLGRALMISLARILQANDLGRLEWDASDWNAPALGFYASLGAERITGSVPHRLTDGALRALAEKR